MCCELWLIVRTKKEKKETSLLSWRLDGALPHVMNVLALWMVMQMAEMEFQLEDEHEGCADCVDGDGVLMVEMEEM